MKAVVEHLIRRPCDQLNAIIISSRFGPPPPFCLPPVAGEQMGHIGHMVHASIKKIKNKKRISFEFPGVHKSFEFSGRLR